VKLEKKKNAFYVTESSPSRKTLLPPTTANFKVAQLLETYLEEVAKDSTINFGQFMKLAELFTEFPRDSDDSIYRAIDGFFRVSTSRKLSQDCLGITALQKPFLLRPYCTWGMIITRCIKILLNLSCELQRVVIARSLIMQLLEVYNMDCTVVKFPWLKQHCIRMLFQPPYVASTRELAIFKPLVMQFCKSGVHIERVQF